MGRFDLYTGPQALSPIGDSRFANEAVPLANTMRFDVHRAEAVNKRAHSNEPC